MSESSSKHEIKSLTGLRGFAATLVMLFHIPVFAGSPTNAVERVIAHGYLAVDLFFILSGFVMSMTYSNMFETFWNWRSYTKFMLRRFGRIYPLYLATTVLSMVLALHYLPGATPISFLTPKSVIENFLLIQGWGLSVSFNVPAWSISTELAAYITFPILLAVFYYSSRVYSGMAIIIIFGILAEMAAAPLPQCPWRQGPLDLTEAGNILPLFRCFAEFCLGIVAFRMSSARAIRKVTAAPFVTSTIGLVTIILLTFKNTDLTIVALFSFLIVGLSKEKGGLCMLLGSKPLYGTGLLSYSIYLLHEPMDHLLEKALRADFPSFWPASIYALIFLMSAGTFFAIERPGRNLFRRLEANIPPKKLLLSMS